MSDTRFEKIEVEKLLLDPENPRLPKSMANKNESEIINYLLSDASLIELMLAIGKNGFFEGEQLLVVPHNDKYIVIEGNRRLSAVKLLHNPEIGKVYSSKISQVIDESAPENIPNKIPCLIFENKDLILKYLGFRHITGIKSWKLLEKARYLTKLKDDYYSNLSIPEASREIAKMIGSRKDYVMRVLTGYELYVVIERNNFYNIRGLDDTSFFFNYLADSLSRQGIADFLNVNLEEDIPTQNLNFNNLKEWTNWLFNKDLPNKIIGDSDNLNNLNRILRQPAALEAFRRGDKISIALEYTDEIDKQFQYAIENALRQMEKADLLTVKVNHFYVSLSNDLTEIYQRIKKIKSAKELRDDEINF